MRTPFRIGLVLLLSGAIVSESWPQARPADYPQRMRRRSPIESKVFLGNWWDYYNRATRKIDSGDLAGAEEDLRKALTYRDGDDPNARAYGVRFQEYYPHYELGLILFDKGQYAEALTELKTSLKNAPLDETYFYIHEAQRQVTRRNGSDNQAPELMLQEPLSGLVTNRSSILFKGVVRDDIYVDEIIVGGRSLLIDKAQSEIEFETEVVLEAEENSIEVTVVDLVGLATTLTVDIRVDRAGPILSLESVRLQAGNRGVQVRGTCLDPSGVSSLIVNGIRVPIPEGATDFRLDQEIPIQDPNLPVRIELLDGFGNSTVADIDPTVRVGQAPGLKDRVQVAAVDFKPAYLAQVRPAGPRIDLEGLRSGDKVFMDEVYVDINIKDPKGVKEVLCNSDLSEVETGTDITFGYHWMNLKDGTNTMEIRARNNENLESLETVSVTCELPIDTGHRLRLAIDWMEGTGVDSGPQVRQAVERFLAGAIADRGRFIVLPREEALKATLQEIEIASSPLVDSSFAPQEGSLLTADVILTAGLHQYDNILFLEMDLTHVQNRRLLCQVDQRVVDKHSRDSLREIAYFAALRLEHEIPIVMGDVREVQSNYYRSTLTKADRVVSGLQVVLFRLGPEEFLRNGRPVGRPPNYLGPLNIAQVQRDFTDLNKIPSIELPAEPVVGDIVVTR